MYINIIQVKDAYIWAVIYQDSTHLQEFDETNTSGRGWAEIGEKPVKEIWLFTPDGKRNYHHVSVPEGATPIFFRRRSIEINLSSEQSAPRPTVHCIGWKRGDEVVYLFIFEDGSTLLSTDLQAV